MHRNMLLICGLLLLVVLSACSGNTTVAPHQQRTPAPAGYVLPPIPAHVGPPFAGDYLTVITKQDATWVMDAPAVIVPTAVGSLSLGEWLISFRNDGYFTAQGPNSNFSAQYEGLGQYKVKGDLMTVQDAKCWEFDGFQAYSATYRWSLQGRILHLTAVGKDLCPIRGVLLTSHSMSKQS